MSTIIPDNDDESSIRCSVNSDVAFNDPVSKECRVSISHQEPRLVILGDAAAVRTGALKDRYPADAANNESIVQPNKRKFRINSKQDSRCRQSRKRSRRTSTLRAGTQTKKRSTSRDVEANGPSPRPKPCNTETSRRVELASTTLASLWQATQIEEMHALIRRVGARNIVGESAAAKQLRDLCKARDDSSLAEPRTHAVHNNEGKIPSVQRQGHILTHYSRAELEKKTKSLQSAVYDLVQEVKTLQKSNMDMMSQMRSAGLCKIRDQPVISLLIKTLEENKQNQHDQEQYLRFQLQAQTRDADKKHQRAWAIYRQKLERLRWHYRHREEEMRHHYKLLQKTSIQRWNAAISTMTELLTRRQLQHKLTLRDVNAMRGSMVAETGVAHSKRDGTIDCARLSKAEMVELLLTLQARQGVNKIRSHPTKNSPPRLPISAVNVPGSLRDQGLPSTKPRTGAKITKAKSTAATTTYATAPSMQPPSYHAAAASRPAPRYGSLVVNQTSFRSTGAHAGSMRPASSLGHQYTDSASRRISLNDSVRTHRSAAHIPAVTRRKNGLHAADITGRGMRMPITIVKKPDPASSTPMRMVRREQFPHYNSNGTIVQQSLAQPLQVVSISSPTQPSLPDPRTVRPRYQSKEEMLSSHVITKNQPLNPKSERIPNIIDITSSDAETDSSTSIKRPPVVPCTAETDTPSAVATVNSCTPISSTSKSQHPIQKS